MIKAKVFVINPVHKVPVYYLLLIALQNESVMPAWSNRDNLFESFPEHRCIAIYLGTRQQDLS